MITALHVAAIGGDLEMVELLLEAGASITSGTDLSAVDIHSMKKSFTITDVHDFNCLSLDYNPNRPNIIASGGEDGFVKFWDIRKPEKLNTVEILKGHTG